MSSTPMENVARTMVIERHSKTIVEYYALQGENWLGRLLKSMSDVIKVNYERSSTVEYRRRVLQNFHDLITDLRFDDAIKRDKPMSAVLSFGRMFGALLDDMVDRTTPSLMFQPSTMAPFVVGEDMGRKRKHSSSSSEVAIPEPQSSLPVSPMAERKLAIPMRKAAGADLSSGIWLKKPPPGDPIYSLPVEEFSFDRRITDPILQSVACGGKRLRELDAIDVSTTRPWLLPVEKPVEIRLKSVEQQRAECEKEGIDYDKLHADYEKEKNAFEARLTLNYIKNNDLDDATKQILLNSIKWPNEDAPALETETEGAVDSKVTETPKEEAPAFKTPKMEGAAVMRAVETPRSPEEGAPAFKTPKMEGGIVKKVPQTPKDGAPALKTPKIEGGATRKVAKTPKTPKVGAPALKTPKSEGGVAREEDTVSEAIVKEWAVDCYDKKATCFKCDKVCPNFHSVSNHLYHQHKGVCQSTFIFRCDGCGKQWSSFRGAIGHVRTAILIDNVGCKNKVVYMWEKAEDKIVEKKKKTWKLVPKKNVVVDTEDIEDEFEETTSAVEKSVAGLKQEMEVEEENEPLAPAM